MSKQKKKKKNQKRVAIKILGTRPHLLDVGQEKFWLVPRLQQKKVLDVLQDTLEPSPGSEAHLIVLWLSLAG